MMELGGRSPLTGETGLTGPLRRRKKLRTACHLAGTTRALLLQVIFNPPLAFSFAIMGIFQPALSNHARVAGQRFSGIRNSNSVIWNIIGGFQLVQVQDHI